MIVLEDTKLLKTTQGEWVETHLQLGVINKNEYILFTTEYVLFTTKGVRVTAYSVPIEINGALIKLYNSQKNFSIEGTIIKRCTDKSELLEYLI